MEKTFEAKHISIINGVVRIVKENEKRRRMKHNLKLEDLKMTILTDYYIDNNEYSTTQVGIIIILADRSGR